MPISGVCSYATVYVRHCLRLVLPLDHGELLGGYLPSMRSCDIGTGNSYLGTSRTRFYIVGSIGSFAGASVSVGAALGVEGHTVSPIFCPRASRYGLRVMWYAYASGDLARMRASSWSDRWNRFCSRCVSYFSARSARTVHALQYPPE